MTHAQITDKKIKKIVECIDNNIRVDIPLPGIGRIHIDRKIPFIVLYTINNNYKDYSVKRIIRSESSYFMFNNSAGSIKQVKKLLESIIRILAAEFGAFLICEISLSSLSELTGESEIVHPRFHLRQSQDRPVDNVIDILQLELKKYYFNKLQTSVLTERKQGAFLKSIKEILSRKILKDYNCFTFGISINSFFINPDTKMPYPMAFRKFQRFFSRSFRRAVFDFIKNNCNRRPGNYQALGKRSFVKNVWEIDRAICDISSMFDLLFYITPYNVDAEWVNFKKSGFDRNPAFHYRPLPVEPSMLKRSLFKIDLTSIEDPVLFQVFSEKQKELDRQVSLLGDRGTKRFIYGSIQLYGAIDENLYKIAENILRHNPEPVTSNKTETYLRAKEIEQRAKKEIDTYRSVNNDIRSKVIVDKNVSGILVSRGDLYVGASTKIRKARINSVLNHEVGTHILTYYNGKSQPFMLLQSGFAGYEELQEGIAILSEYLSGGLTAERLRILAARVLAAKQATSGAAFMDTFRYLTKEFNFSKKLSFIITMRIYRSGGFIKDYIYLKGFIRLIEYLSKENDWKYLFYGKVSFEQLPFIIELESRKILNRDIFFPHYMKKFDKKGFISNINSVKDLLQIG